MLAVLLSPLGKAVSGVALFAGVIAAAYAIGHQRGAVAERTESLSRSVEILRERARTDETIRNLSDRDLCIELGGLPDECAGIGL